MMQTTKKYVDSIWRRQNEAVHVPFLKVEIWTPEVARCHENVDKWVEYNPGTAAVRGWISYANLGWTAHSVVKDAAGDLFDITPFGDNSHRDSIRFIPHLGDDAEFFSIKEEIGGTIHWFTNPELDMSRRAAISVPAPPDEPLDDI